MRHITEAGQGREWFEVETAAEAIRAGEEGQTAFGVLRQKDVNSGRLGRYFVLQDSDGAGIAYCRIPAHQPELEEYWFTGSLGSEPMYDKPVIVAQRNENPFPSLHDAIQALAGAVMVQIDESCYPCGTRDRPQLSFTLTAT
jgi:hypothetical protein